MTGSETGRSPNPTVATPWGWVVHTVGVVVGLPARVEAMLDDVADLLATVRSRLEEVDRAVVEVRDVCADAARVVGAAGATGRAVDDLVGLYDQAARDAAPLVDRFVGGLSPSGVDAATTLVDQLPALTEHLRSDVLPVLETLDQVAPDLHELLALTKKGRQAVDGLPGADFLRRRGAAKE